MNNARCAYSSYDTRAADNQCCAQRNELPRELSLAMAYVPFQQWCDDIYTLDKALCQGTLFPALDLPFTMGGRCR